MSKRSLAVGLWLIGSCVFAQGVKTVVIDAGHGGKDPGCHGSMINEKEVCLNISLALGALIKEYFPDVKVVYTRKTDVFVELYKRASIANKAKADLFICIHVNAAGSAAAHGAETYVLGLHRTDDNLAVAKRENAAVVLEDNYEENYEGFDPNSDEGNIIFSLYQSAYLNQSLEFAGHVQHYFVEHAGRHNRGVRQAGFLVLVKTAMPSVLIETGFATNPAEEKFLASKQGVQKMAESLFMAFARYKKSREGAKYAGMAKVFPHLKEHHSPGSQAPSSESPEAPPAKSKEGVHFAVQFMSSKEQIPLSDPRLKKIPEVHVYDQNDGWYRYLSGWTSNYNEILSIKDNVHSLGYTDAFLVAYNNGQKIGISEALSIVGKKD